MTATIAVNPAVVAPHKYHPNAQPTRRDELVGGHWEKRPGGLRVWVEDETDWDYVIKADRDDTPPPEPIWHVTGVLCECGALLRNEAELCPACVIPWCRNQEIRASWRPTFEKGAAA